MSENEIIEIEVTNTAQDYRRVLFLQSYKKVLIAGILYLVVVTPMLWLTFFGAGANPFEEKNGSIILVMIFFALLPVLIAVAIFWNIYKQAKMIGQTLTTAKFIFSSEGVESNSATSQVKVDWKTFEKIQELKEDFLFFPQKNFFYTIPKRFFQNENQIAVFKSLVRENLGVKAKLQK
jgi:hypothetical protein